MADAFDARPLKVPSGRLGRLARLGAMAGGVAGGMAAHGLRSLAEGRRPALREMMLTPGNVRRVADELSRMRGAAMKIGQLMSMDSGDMLPPELAQIMARLRAGAHHMPPKQLRDVLDAAWGPGWLRHFESFDVRPIAAASIGQVHRARLRDGRELAIKVQYPGVARSIDSDVANVGALIRISGLIPRGFDLAPFLEEGRRQLHEETDYAREGAFLARFRALMAGDDRFTVPAPAPDWTRPGVLAMGYAPGQPIETLESAGQDLRDRVAAALMDLTLRELFVFGVMQTDPNFANYRYDPASGRIVLLDFGAARELDPGLVEIHRRLVSAGMKADLSGMERAAAALGIVGPDTDPRHRLRLVGMMEMAFEAMRAPAFDFASPDLSRRMQAEGEALAREGFLPPPVPMEALWVQRKLGGMAMLAARLRARVPVAALIDAALGTGSNAGAQPGRVLG